MPILEKDTPKWIELIEPLNLSAGIPSQYELPDIAAAIKAGGASVEVGAAERDTRDGAAISNIANQLGVGGVAQAFGIPSTLGQWAGAKDGFLWNRDKNTPLTPAQLEVRFTDALDDIEDAGQVAQSVMTALNNIGGSGDLPLDFGVEIFGAFEDAIGPAMNAISGIASIAGTFVPIIGAFTKFVSVLANLAIRAADGGNPKFDNKVFTPLEFSPGNDRWFAEEYFLDPMRGQGPGSINSVFHPIGYGVGDALSLAEEGGGDTVVGYRLEADNYSRAWGRRWAGFMPGSLLLDRGWEISKAGSINTGTRPLGGLLPTAENLGSKLWGMVTKPGSPLMYTISPSKLRPAWISYLFNLRWKIENWGYWSESAKKNFIFETLNLYGWSTYPLGQGNNMKEVPRPSGSGTIFIDKDKSYGLGNCVPVRALNELEALQRTSMDQTVVCAYVDDSGKYYLPNRDRWRDNRMLLLQHPDRCTVDVDSIPDKAYRDAMRAAQASCGSGMILTMRPLRQNADPMVAVTQTLATFDGATEEATGEGSTGKGGLLIAAAVLGLIALNKKR